MNFIRKCLILYLYVNLTKCSRLKRLKIPTSDDPCNPLYWYPKNIPEYCKYRTTMSRSLDNSMFDWIRVPPKFPPLPVPYPQISIMPSPSFGMPYGLPYPNPMQPSYSPAFQPQIGMVPGLPGIVSKDGGINIMPFSDVYADILKEHKNKMIRKRLRKIIDKYERRYRVYE